MDKNKKFRILTVVVVASAVCCASASADIVVNHQPHPFGGFSSDTDFVSSQLPSLSWQQVADDFYLADSTIVRRISWWGFYSGDVAPESESMRVRFYGSRSSDGLPDDSNLIRKQIVQNPARMWTGRMVASDGVQHEYQFAATLDSELQLNANAIYWLEIVQLDDLATKFRWEFSLADRDGQAVKNVLHDWETSYPGVVSDAAFQLSTTPEPASLYLLLLGSSFSRGTRGTFYFNIGGSHRVHPLKRAAKADRLKTGRPCGCVRPI